MRRREPPKEKSNLGPWLSDTAVASLLRALRTVRVAPNRRARFDDPSAPTGPARAFTPDEIIALAQRLERLAAKGARARIAVTPETANLWARALRAYAARPHYDDVLEAVCGMENCASRATCYDCRGKTNLIIQIFEGQAGCSLALKHER